MGYDITEPRWSGENSIDVVWNHPVLSPRLGPLPYTVLDGSGEPEMQDIWDRLMAGEFGSIAPLEE